MYRGWVGKAEIRQPGKYKLNKTFCHLVLGLQFFSPQEHPLSELSYDIKILSQFLSPMLRLLSKLTVLIKTTVREKICIKNLAKYSHFFSTRSYFKYCGLDVCNCCLSMLWAVHLVSGALIIKWFCNLFSLIRWQGLPKIMFVVDLGTQNIAWRFKTNKLFWRF